MIFWPRKLGYPFKLLSVLITKRKSLWKDVDQIEPVFIFHLESQYYIYIILHIHNITFLNRIYINIPTRIFNYMCVEHLTEPQLYIPRNFLCENIKHRLIKKKSRNVLLVLTRNCFLIFTLAILLAALIVNLIGI